MIWYKVIRRLTLALALAPVISCHVMFMLT